MIPSFTPENWFWIVGGDDSRAWSSLAGAYVSDYPADDRITRIGSETDLNDVLRPHGLTLPAPQLSDYQDAIRAHVDAVAKAKEYDSGISCAGYATSTIPSWAAEATTFIAWRDSVWVYVYEELAKVQAGQRAQPTVSAFLDELPSIDWP